MKKEETIKQIEKALSDLNIDPNLKKSLEEKKRILTGNKEVKK